jgi:ABC-type sugar transport system substrate-binding protein/anti-anti-sigma regulatory factor
MRIGFASQHPTSDFWLIINHGVQERTAELGIDCTITSATTLEEQIAAIHTFVEQRVDVLLLGPMQATGLASTIAQVRAARIPAVVLATQLGDCETTCTVRSDHTRGGELAAAYLAVQLGGAGQVAHLVGPSQLQDMIDRANGIRRVLSQHAGIQVVYEREIPDWQTKSAAALMREALERYPALRGVCVATDNFALGAIAAIEAAGRTGQIIVTGFDATPFGLQAIHQGRMSASVSQSTREIGRTAVQMAWRIAHGEAVPPLVYSDIALVSSATLLDAALEAIYLLPKVLRDAIERGEALARARDEIIRSQEAALRELSTPLIPLSDAVVVMPLIGTVDSKRAQQILETLLQGVATTRATTVILDITGVLVVDTQVANALVRAAQAVKLLGAGVVLTGIRPEVAQTLVGLGIDLRGIVTLGTLQSGVAFALN